MMINESRRSRAHFDIPLVLLVFGLAAFGVLSVSVPPTSTLMPLSCARLMTSPMLLGSTGQTPIAFTPMAMKFSICSSWRMALPPASAICTFSPSASPCSLTLPVSQPINGLVVSVAQRPISRVSAAVALAPIPISIVKPNRTQSNFFIVFSPFFAPERFT